MINTYEETNDTSATTTDLPLDRPLMTPKEVAKLLGKSLAQTYEAIHQGQLPSVRIGRYYVPRAALEHLFLHGRLPECSALHSNRQALVTVTGPRL
jgi:excisionase family DNA binding protein